MAWTTPLTWEDGRLVTASDMNTYISDNLTHLYDRLATNDEYTANEASDYTTTSTSFVDIDATNLSLTITTHGGDVLVGFTGFVQLSGAGTQYVHFNVDVDGSPQFADDGLGGAWDAGTRKLVSFVVLIEGLTAGSHTFKLKWKSQIGGTITLYAGAGTSNLDVHPQFWVQEL